MAHHWHKLGVETYYEVDALACGSSDKAETARCRSVGVHRAADGEGATGLSAMDRRVVAHHQACGGVALHTCIQHDEHTSRQGVTHALHAPVVEACGCDATKE